MFTTKERNVGFRLQSNLEVSIEKQFGGRNDGKLEDDERNEIG
jgi:hypothetical protein